MRTLVRPFLLFAALCGFAAISQSQMPAPGGQVNVFQWTKGFPTPTVGGVDTSVDIVPAAGWTCTEVTIRVIDGMTNKTLGEYTAVDPGPVVSKSFTELPNMLSVRVTGDAVLQNGGAFDFKQIQALTITK
jgi:hypothetical protein